MQRSTLVEALETVSPALSTNNMIPVLSHFWFLGERVMTFNDQIGISTKLKTSFKGAVPGETSLKLLRNAGWKEVEMKEDGKELIVKANNGKAEMILAILPEEDFIFTMPEFTDNIKATAKLPKKVDGFLHAVGQCMRSVSADTTVPDRLGVTLIPKKTELVMYSTNGVTMTRAALELEDAPIIPRRVCLSELFCLQLLRLTEHAKLTKLEITEQHSLAETDAGTVLFGRLVDILKPIDYDNIFENHFTEEDEELLVKIPGAMGNAIERAIVITSSSTDKTQTSVKVADERLVFHSRSSRGEMHDDLKIGKHPEASGKFDPEMLKMGLADFDQMLVTKRCIIMKRDNVVYMISNSA